MEKKNHKKSSSPGKKLSDCLFRGVMYILYGKKAGETAIEKTVRLGSIIIVLAALIIISSIIKNSFFSRQSSYQSRPAYRQPVGQK